VPPPRAYGCRHSPAPGKESKRKPRGCGAGGHLAGPAQAADSKLYFSVEESGVRVVRAGPKFEVPAVNPLGDPCMATPAISDGMILIRTQHSLFGIVRDGVAKE
jgi:hypothetical protein